MKFNYKKDLSPKYLLVALSAISIILILVSAFSPNTLKGLKNMTRSLITPLQKGVNNVGTTVSGWFDGMEDARKLKKENEKLQDRISELEYEQERNQAELTELSELRNLYDLDNLYPEYKKTAARVFSVDTSGWFNEFYINKGLNDGVYENCNVICDNGLLGIVTESYSDHAKVRAIIDDTSNATCQIGSDGVLCNVEGSLRNMKSGYLLATDIDKDANVQVGDKVITSNVSDRYLYGITVGYVQEITNDSNNLTKTAKIVPVVNFNDVSDVFVLLERKMEVDY